MAVSSSRSRRSLAGLAPLLGTLFFAAALFLLHRELAGFHYRDVLGFLRSLPHDRLFLALGLTAASYLALTGYDTLGARWIGHPLSWRRTAFAALVSSAVSNTLGLALLTGTPLRARLYTRWGLSAIDIGRLVLFCYATFWLGFCTLAGAAFLAVPIALPSRLGLPVATVRPLGVLLLALVAAYLALVLFVRRPFVVKGLEVRPPSLPLALGQIAVAALDWALAGGVLYSLLPPAWQLPFPHFLVVFLFAQVAGLVSNVPGGLGVFETVIVLLLPPDLPRPQLLAALVAWRGVYYLLPLLAAALALGAHEVALRRAQVGRLARRIGALAPDVVPQVLAAATFLGGLVLLLSGATPALHNRLRGLDQLVPLTVIELSHFLGSLAGVGLLFLAAGLQRRLDVAYHLAALLLAGGAVLSLLKGLDWEEALVLTALLAALLPCRAHFNRRASLLAEPFTPGWIAALAVALGASLWLGLFAYQHVDYSTELWWRFTLSGNAPRFLRAAVGTLVLALGLAVRRLLRPAAPEPDEPSTADLDKAEALAARSPRTYAWLALLGDKRLLFHPEGDAFLMFGVERRSWIALGDPVGAEERQADLAWALRELADRHGGWTVFYQVAPQRLHLYVDLGLSLVKLGEEGRVPLTDFSLEGSRRKKLRQVWRRAQEEKMGFEVVPVPGVPALLPVLEEISNGWMRAKNTREKGFSLGRFDPDYLQRFPVAVVRQDDGQDGRIVAFANLWPGGGQEELSVDLMRHREDAPAGVMDFLFLELMLWGKEQGYQWFSMGMAPLSGLEERTLAPLWNRVGALVFRHGEHFYNFQGLRRYKEKFDPVWEPRYLACPGGLALPRVLADVAALIAGGLRGVVSR